MKRFCTWASLPTPRIKTGVVIARGDARGVSEQTLRSVCRGFEGQIDQVPPVYSALKHRGVPLYKLARRGEPVVKAARRKTIESLRILAVDLPRVWMTVTCSAGTYIRTLCADIGAALGCGGTPGGFAPHRKQRLQRSGRPETPGS